MFSRHCDSCDSHEVCFESGSCLRKMVADFNNSENDVNVDVQLNDNVTELNESKIYFTTPVDAGNI